MTEINKLYQLYLKCNQNICIDSRSDKIKNSIFFGIKGEKFDGNIFIKQAIEKGAQFAVSDNKNYIDNSKIIYVKDTLKALQELSKLHRKNISIPIIAITGTNGKTTTKELVNHILSTTFSTCSTKGNFNNHIGVPLTLLSLKKTHQIGVVELGANHPGEIDFLCSIAQPTHGIITNIGKAHLEGFGNFKNIISTKGELYDYLKKQNGLIFINNHDKLLIDLLDKYKKIKEYCAQEYSNTNKNKSNVLNFTCDPFIKIIWEKKSIETKIIGNYNSYNIAAAITIAKYFKINDKNIYNSLKKLELKNNRSEFIQTKKNQIILDAYNANPTSTTCAIKNFINIKNNTYPHRLIILGDMLELGNKENQYHQKIVNLLERSKIKSCFLIGSIFNKTNCNKNYIKIASVDNCIKTITKNKIENTMILIKGSRKMRLEKIIDFL